jgi:hypothetical protein
MPVEKRSREEGYPEHTVEIWKRFDEEMREKFIYV